MADAPRFDIADLFDDYFDQGVLKRGQVGFDHIIKDYGEEGTTCGYLVHWMLWRMGCTDADLINRFEPDRSFKYRPTKNISIITEHPLFSLRRGMTYQDVARALFSGQYVLDTGDIVMVKGAPMGAKQTSSEHVFVVLQTVSQTPDLIKLEIAQAGSGTTAANQRGETKTIDVRRSMAKTKVGAEEYGGPLAVIESGIAGVGERPIIGFMNLDLLPWDPLPAVLGLDTLTWRSGETTNASLEKAVHDSYSHVVGSIWDIEYGSDYYYYLFYKGHRVFYASRGTSTLFKGSGVWYAKASGIEIKWDRSGVQESYLFASGSPVKLLQGYSSEGQFVKATKLDKKPYTVVLNSYKNGQGMPITP